MKELTTQELAIFLGITRQGLKKMIDNKNLAAKLLEKNYKLIKSEKQGRKIVYFLQEIVVVQKEQWDDYMKREFPNIRKKDEYGDFCEERLNITNPLITTKEISKKVKVSQQTLTNWNNTLTKKGILMDNGYSYFKIVNGKKPVEITYGEYLQYWRDYNKLSREEEKILELMEGEQSIPQETVKGVTRGLCVKVKTYLVNQFTNQYEEMMNALSSRRQK